jgi:type II secretory pathway pseudopilin PulG
MISGRKAMPNLSGENGLTLLEILLAMVMLAAVVTMVTLSISGSLQVIDATERQGEAYYRAQVALQRIGEDLSAALLVDNIEFNGSSGENDGGRGNILEFTSTAHVVFDPANDHPGIALIAYILRPDPEEENSFLLLRRDNRLRPSDTAEMYRSDDTDAFLLCDRLRSVTFLYLDEAGEEFERWTSLPDDVQDTESRKLPVSVKVTLEFWLDREEDQSIAFTTGVLLPVGLMEARLQEGDNG